MSETARRFLEQRVPELEDLFKKRLFSKEEIKEIVAKRTQFEHKIKRNGCLKDDFVAYINYECELEVIRKQRYRDLNIKGKHTVSDHSIVKYILSIYSRALLKFKGDVSLWEAYVQFAKDSKSEKVVPKILASALQLHPDSASLWINSANWEFDYNSNPASARALYQRGIRINRESKALWLAYFQMECNVVAKLIESKNDIGSTNTTGNDEPSSAVLRGAIPIAVFKHAAKEISMKAHDAFDFYCISSSIPEVQLVTEFLDQYIENNMPDHYRYQLLKAERIAQSISFDDENFSQKLQYCMILLGSALNSEQGSESLSEIVDILILILNSAEENLEFSKIVYEKISKILSGALNKMPLPPALFIKWASLALKVKEDKVVPKILEIALELYPTNDAILDLAAKNQVQIKNDKLFDACKNAIESGSNDAVPMIDKIFSNNLLNMELKLSLGSIAMDKILASEQVVAFMLEHKTLEELFIQVHEKRITPRFVTCLLNVLIRKLAYDQPSFNIVAKLIAFCDSVYSHAECALVLLKFAFLSGELDYVSRVYSKTIATIANPDRFIFEFECMKDTLCS